MIFVNTNKNLLLWVWWSFWGGQGVRVLVSVELWSNLPPTSSHMPLPLLGGFPTSLYGWVYFILPCLNKISPLEWNLPLIPSPWHTHIPPFIHDWANTLEGYHGFTYVWPASFTVMKGHSDKNHDFFFFWTKFIYLISIIIVFGPIMVSIIFLGKGIYDFTWTDPHITYQSFLTTALLLLTFWAKLFFVMWIVGIFNSVPVFYSVDARSSYQLRKNKTVSDIVKCSLGGKTVPDWEWLL